MQAPASFNIQNTAAVKTAVKNLSAGTYQFELKVTDNGGLMARDTMSVILDAIFTTNHPPMVMQELIKKLPYLRIPSLLMAVVAVILK